jgi:hypothetical protein
LRDFSSGVFFPKYLANEILEAGLQVQRPDPFDSTQRLPP